jgi:MSHA biogenesis protein MshP
MYPNSGKLRSPQRQQGFLIPLALFILVGLLALALAVSRLTGQSGTSATLEPLSTQAFYAAESGGQYAMRHLFFDANDRAVVDAKCDGWSETVDFSAGSAPGMQTCRAEVQCSLTSTADTSFYTITSTGRCGSGSLSAQRTIQISAFMQ